MQKAMLLPYENTELQARFITLFYTETANNHLLEGLFFLLLSRCSSYILLPISVFK